MKSIFILIVYCALTTFGLFPFSLKPGPCPKLPNGLVNFNPEKFSGHWYQIVATFSPNTINYGCLEARFELTNNDQSFNLTLTQKMKPDIKLGQASIPRNSSTLMFPRDTWVILDTDYDNYAVVRGCSFSEIFHNQEGYILSRNTTLDSATMEKAENLLEQSGVPLNATQSCF